MCACKNKETDLGEGHMHEYCVCSTGLHVGQSLLCSVTVTTRYLHNALSLLTRAKN